MTGDGTHCYWRRAGEPEAGYHWTHYAAAAAQCYAACMAAPVGAKANASGVMDRLGNLSFDPSRMAEISRRSPGQWTPITVAGNFGLRCVCGRTATSPRDVERHVCAVWAALSLVGCPGGACQEKK